MTDPLTGPTRVDMRLLGSGVDLAYVLAMLSLSNLDTTAPRLRLARDNKHVIAYLTVTIPPAVKR